MTQNRSLSLETVQADVIVNGNNKPHSLPGFSSEQNRVLDTTEQIKAPHTFAQKLSRFATSLGFQKIDYHEITIPIRNSKTGEKNISLKQIPNCKATVELIDLRLSVYSGPVEPESAPASCFQLSTKFEVRDDQLECSVALPCAFVEVNVLVEIAIVYRN